MLRKCWNIQSQKHPDVQCTRDAMCGDFCILHVKHPHYFMKKQPTLFDDLAPHLRGRLRRFFHKVHIHIGLLKYRLQGPAVYDTTLATNDTEVFSMEPTHTIPSVYRFSFRENTNTLWLFDIRTLLTEKKIYKHIELRNPYTRQSFSSDVLLKLQRYIEWLHKRKYFTEIYTSTSELVSIQQHYQQKILELCLFIDAHGYLTNTYWFEDLSLEDIWEFCNELDDLWLDNLTYEERVEICPWWNEDYITLFTHERLQTRHKSTALDRICTCLFEFVQASPIKENRALACMYILMALCNVSDDCHETYSWLFQ